MEAAFAEVGVTAHGSPRPPAGNGVGFHLPVWIYEVAVGGFLTAFAAAAGQDAWKGMKRIVGRVKEWFDERYGNTPPHDRVTLILGHRESETYVYVASDIPDKAYQALFELEVRPGGVYNWAEDAEEWEDLAPD